MNMNPKSQFIWQLQEILERRVFLEKDYEYTTYPLSPGSLDIRYLISCKTWRTVVGQNVSLRNIANSWGKRNPGGGFVAANFFLV